MARNLGALCESLQDDVLGLAVDEAFVRGQAMIRTRVQFSEPLQEGEPRLMDIAREVYALVGEVLETHCNILAARARVPVNGTSVALSDIATQLEHLVYRGFVRELDLDELGQFPRYLAALALRIDRLRQAPAKDALKLTRMGSVWQRCRELLRQNDVLELDDPELRKLRWMVEEFRASLFAQELGTALPISAKRLDEQLSRTTDALIRGRGHAAP